jgi:hypothetical protein
MSEKLDLAALRARANELRDWYFDVDEGDNSVYATGGGPHDHSLVDMRRRPKEAVCALLNAAPALLAAASERDELRAEVEALRAKLDSSIGLIADWCFRVSQVGTGWDDWDEAYKDAMYRPHPLREMIDAAVNTMVEEYKREETEREQRPAALAPRAAAKEKNDA